MAGRSLFGFAPDEELLRELVAAAAGDDAAAQVEFGLTEKRDWVANSLAGLAPVRAGRSSSTARTTARALKANDVGVEIEAGLAFGTGHHGTTRGCLLHFDRLLKRRRPRYVLDVGCGAGVLAIAAAKVLRRKVWLGDLDPVAVEVADANARLNGVAAHCQPLLSRGVENLLMREGAPYDVVFANILAKPLRLLAPSLAAVTRATATPSSRACSTRTSPASSPPGARKASSCASASTSKAGRASGCRGDAQLDAVMAG